MGDIVEVADDDQATRPGVDDVVDPLAQSASRGDHVEGPE